MVVIVSVQDKIFSGKRTDVYKSFWSPQPSRKSFTVTILWSLAKFVKSYPGIIELDARRMVLLKVRGVKDGTSAVLLQSGLDEMWWADSVECVLFSAKRSRPLIGRGKHNMNGDLETHAVSMQFLSDQ